MIHLALALFLAAVPPVQNANLQKALAAYENLDYDGAGALFDDVLQEQGLSRDDQKVADFYAGIVYFDLGQTEKSRDVFGRALTLDPTLTLDSDASPKLQAFFADIKKNYVVAAPPPATASDVPAAASPAETKPALATKPTSDLGGDFDDDAASHKPLYRKPLFWVGVGAAAVAVTVVVVLLATHGSSCSSSGNNGCIELQVQQKQGLLQW